MAATTVGAEAFTFGNHVVLGDPSVSTTRQDWLLAHEIGHVIQQDPRNTSRQRSEPEREADRYADRSLSQHSSSETEEIGTQPQGLARRVISRTTVDLPGNLLLIVDVDDGDFVGGCVRQIVPHVGVKLIMKGVPKGAGNQIFNVHIGFLTNAAGEFCVFFYESVSGICEMKCFPSREEIDWEEIKEWLKEMVRKLLEALAIAAILILLAILVYLIVEAIIAALAAVLVLA